MKTFIALLVILPVAAQNRSGPSLDGEVIDFSRFVRISRVHAAVLESGRVIWQDGDIKEPAPEEPVIAERLERLAESGRISLDDAVPMPKGATIRQVLSNTADGTPGEEVLQNRSFFGLLKPIAGTARAPNALKFASADHNPLGWFAQEYAGETIFWTYGPRVLLVRVPSKHRTLVVSAKSAAMTESARLEDGNVLRSTVALLFLQDVAKLGSAGADNIIDRAFDFLYQGQREQSIALMREVLKQFPELESTPDVTLLYLFAQLGLPETEASATAVIKAHPSLPTAWFYYGQYLENSKRYREAAACFEKITMHQPPWHHWTVASAQKELTYLKTY